MFIRITPQVHLAPIVLPVEDDTEDDLCLEEGHLPNLYPGSECLPVSSMCRPVVALVILQQDRPKSLARLQFQMQHQSKS